MAHRDSLPVVTVVTPSYNHGRFIRDTIESVLTQDYPSVEYLIVDGGSTDETVSILREYSGRLWWTSERDSGQASAVNKGWRRGRGEILGWLNSDDVYLPGAVGVAVDFLTRHPEIDAVYGEGYHTDEAGRVLEPYPTEPFALSRLKTRCIICQPTVFLRRRVVEQVGYLNESLQLSLDYDLWIRIGMSARFGYVPHTLAATRLHPATKTLARRREVYAEILETIRRHFGSVPATWVYAYAKAIAEDAVAPGCACRRLRVSTRLVAATLSTFVAYNRRHPLAGFSGLGYLCARAWSRHWRLRTTTRKL